MLSPIYRQTSSKHSALTRFRHGTVGLRDISPHPWIPEATSAAQLMDKCVNMRSIWAQRPPTSLISLCVELWHIKVPHADPSAGRRKAVRGRNVELTCEWWLHLNSRGFFNWCLHNYRNRSETLKLNTEFHWRLHQSRESLIIFFIALSFFFTLLTRVFSYKMQRINDCCEVRVRSSNILAHYYYFLNQISCAIV